MLRKKRLAYYTTSVKFFCFFLMFSFILVITVVAGVKQAPVKKVEDFSIFKTGTFPKGWKCRGGKGSDVYSVISDEDSYLEAKSVKNAVTIAKKFEYDLNEYPFLSWQWRILELPKGADERYKKTGDSAAAIYVVFQKPKFFRGSFRPKNIKYVWSTSLPKGTTTHSPYNSKTKIVVLQSQSSLLGTWVSEKVNVYEDYKRLFGKKPKSVKAIGLMSDSDNTKSKAIAHYKEIIVSKE